MQKKRFIPLVLFTSFILGACSESMPSASSAQPSSSNPTSSTTSSQEASQQTSSDLPSSGEASQNPEISSEASTAPYSSEASQNPEISSEASTAPYSSEASAAPYSSELPSSQAASSVKPSSSENPDIVHLPAIDHIKIFCPKEYTSLYAWLDGNKEILGGWPGSSSALTSYDNNWKTYDFGTTYSEVNFIFSKNGQDQTADLNADKAGYYWFYQGGLYEQDYDPAKYGGSGNTDIQQGNYDVVNSASSYTDLPALSKFAQNSIVSPYKGNRTDFRDESIYFIMTTRFFDGDSSNNVHCWDGLSKGLNENDPEWRGDFKGLIERMDYIKALGFTSIWITPVVKNASGYDYHGYHAINFKEVDPRYESKDATFQDVINAAHAKDMKIVLDVVFNHSGNFGEENMFPMFKYDPGKDASIKGMVRNEESGLLNKSYDKLDGNSQYGKRIDTMKNANTDIYNIYHHEKSFGYEQYIEQTGQMAGDCVDLNTENPTVANYLVEAYGKYIQMGVDAFRIDTMKHISRYTLNKYYFPSFLAIAKKVGNPYFHMFGEVCSRWSESVWNHNNPNCSAPFYTWAENKSYNWGSRETNEATTKTFYEANNSVSTQPKSNNHKLNGVTYHAPDKSRFNGNSVIDFQMHWNFDNAGSAYNMALGWDDTYQDATYNVVYVDSHDYGPQNQEKFRYQGGTAAWKENMSLMFTFRGVPCVYYGSEVEFKKGAVIDVGPNANLEDTGRAYFGNNLAGSVTASGFGTYSANGTVKSTLDKTLSQHLIKLNKARLKCIALRRGQYTTSNVSNNSSTAAFTRRYTANGVDSIACVVISGSATFNNLPNGTYTNLYGGGTATVSNGTLRATASGQGNVAIYVKG